MSAKEWHEFLSRVDAFFGLSVKEREALISRAWEIEARRKELVIKAKTPFDTLYVITRGAIKTVRSNHQGQNFIADILRPGDILGEEGVLLTADSEYDAVPFDQAALLSIPVEEVKKVMETQPRLGRAFAALCSSRARLYRERLFMGATRPAPARLSQALYYLARRFGKRDRQGTMIDLRITHQDLAEYIGASRETVTLFLSRFKDEGLVTMKVRRIIIPDMKALKKYSES